MLHKYEKIDEAMAACVSLEYPLIVVLHGKLPSALSNADEATRGASGGSARAYSFLPSSYNMGNSNALAGASGYGSCSFFADETAAPADAPVAGTAPDQEAAAANAALGYLMRPANMTPAAAADRAAVAKAVADGEELTLAPEFPLGSVQGGAAQREALLVTLLESRLGSVTLLHLIEEGTPAYESFTAAVPIPNVTSATPPPGLPRVHIFFAPSVGLAPMALHGATLTPQNLNSCVQMGLLQPRIRPDPSITSTSPAASLRAFLTTSVTAMNREFARSRHQQHSDPSASAAPAGSHPPVAPSGGAAAAPVMAAPAARAKGVTRADALAAAHLISLAGLPTCFSNGPIPASSTGSHSTSSVPVATSKTILTTPTMTLQTVWRSVEKHLEWAQHEVQQAQDASVWNGISPPKPGASFTLTIVASDAAGGATGGSAVSPPVVVRSLAEAAKVRLQDFPRNTVVQVEFDGWRGDSAATSSAAPAPSPTAQSKASAPGSGSASHPPSSDYVCEGDVCRRRLPGEAAPPQLSALPAPSSEAPQQSGADAAAAEKANAAVASTVPSTSNATASAATAPPTAALVKLHCSLPNGKTLDVERLDPSSATLQADVRPAVEVALGYSTFLFVCAYPPKRYSVEGDEPRLLKDIGLGRSSALRVVSLDGPGSPSASTAPGVQQQQTAGHARQMLSTAASSLMGMLAGRRGDAAGARSSDPGPSSSAGASHAPPSSSQRRPFNSMAAMLAANEESERETAMERARQQQQQQPASGQDPADTAQQQQQQQPGKKSNRYFGGDSTEYIGEDKDENPSRTSTIAEMTQEQRDAFLREQLQRLMRQQQNPGAAEDEDEEEDVEGQQRLSSGRNVRAFQGPGRRLAGDAPSTTSDSQNTAPPPPPSDSSSAAKKNQ